MTSQNDTSPAWKVVFGCFLLLLVGLSIFFYVGACYTAQINYCLSPNEGWNAFFAKAAMTGEALYPTPDKLITNNYPPLSFYVTGLLGNQLGDHLAAGRILSLIATMVITFGIAGIVRQLGGTLAGSIAGGALFLATLCDFYDYVGQNDPQLLAQAIMILGALWFLKRKHSGRGLTAPLVTMVVAGFFKHNIIALPAASLLWILLQDRRCFLRLAITALLLSIGGLVLCRFVYGSSFLYNFCTPRGFFWSQGGDALPDLVRHAALPVILFLPVAWALRKDVRIQFASLLMGISLIAFYLESCGDGVGPNAEFDVVIAASIGFGLAVTFLGQILPLRFRIPHLVGALLIVAACISLWPAQDALAVRLLLDHRALQEQRHQTEVAMEEAIAKCREMPNNVYCDPTVLYLAGKPFIVDSYNTSERILYGRLPKNAIETLYRNGSLSFVENPYNYLNQSWYPY
jgi:4-amino-4-deoxy-L-arabinose transferase-like glycosyltransferase